MIEQLRGGLYSSVVGSFPYKVDRTLLEEADWNMVEGIKKTSQTAVEFQLGCGINFPSDGQFFDMVDMYLRPLMGTGFLTRGRSLGEGKVPSVHPSLALDVELEPVVRKKGGLGLRVPITGPFTLGYRVKADGKNVVENGDSDALLRLADAVKSFCKGFNGSLKGSILSVDEPVLPFVVNRFGESFVQDVLNDIFDVIDKNYSCMHICGSVREIKELALSLGVDILDHEFVGTDNAGLYSRRELEDSGKLLSCGLVNTNPRQVFPKDGTVIVESVDEIKKSLDAACKKYGLDNLLISPDCGFGGWTALRTGEEKKWNIIREKLSNMVGARDEYLSRK